jgi:hypothetical protein
MTQKSLLEQAEELTAKFEAKSLEAAELDAQIEAKYGFPAADNRAKNDEHAVMSMRYYVLLEDAENLRQQQIEITRKFEAEGFEGE